MAVLVDSNVFIYNPRDFNRYNGITAIRPKRSEVAVVGTKSRQESCGGREFHPGELTIYRERDKLGFVVPRRTSTGYCGIL